MRGQLLALAALIAVVPGVASAQEKPLEVEVLRSGPASLHVNMALIKGEKDAILVDAPFTLSDAHRAVASIIESGRDLKYIFITHDHPDHFFAMEVVQDAFPNARIVAHPTVVADIWRSLPFKVKRWSPALGSNGPRQPTAPIALEGDVIELEGHRLEVLGPMQGDHHNATALWAPSIKALFPGDLVFNQVHLWLGEHDAAQVAAWGDALDDLAALKPELVVAGHAKPGTPDDISGIEFSRRYITEWPKLIAVSKDSVDFRDKVRAKFPDAQDELDDFILGNSSKVAMGEEPKWEE